MIDKIKHSAFSIHVYWFSMHAPGRTRILACVLWMYTDGLTQDGLWHKTDWHKSNWLQVLHLQIQETRRLQDKVCVCKYVQTACFPSKVHRTYIDGDCQQWKNKSVCTCVENTRTHTAELRIHAHAHCRGMRRIEGRLGCKRGMTGMIRTMRATWRRKMLQLMLGHRFECVHLIYVECRFECMNSFMRLRAWLWDAWSCMIVIWMLQLIRGANRKKPRVSCHATGPNPCTILVWLHDMWYEWPKWCGMLYVHGLVSG